MVKIRLARGGKKGKPFYRIVVAEKTTKRSGKPLEILGFWDPANDKLKIDKKKVKYWIDKGAQPTKAVSDLIK